MVRRSHLLFIIAIILLVLIVIPHGRFLIGGPHMRELAIIGIICLLAFGAIKSIHAQGFTGPRSDSTPGTSGPAPGGPLHEEARSGAGQSVAPQPGNGQYGFTGPTKIITVSQAQSLVHRTPVIIRGNIVIALGADLYTFSDSSGEIYLRIGPKEWENFGSTISPSETIEISGELHRDPRDNQRAPEIHARTIRKQ